MKDITVLKEEWAPGKYYTPQLRSAEEDRELTKEETRMITPELVRSFKPCKYYTLRILRKYLGDGIPINRLGNRMEEYGIGITGQIWLLIRLLSNEQRLDFVSWIMKRASRIKRIDRFEINFDDLRHQATLARKDPSASDVTSCSYWVAYIKAEESDIVQKRNKDIVHAQY